MTSLEISRSSMLEILFEHRNKDYGAYALRLGYNHRLLVALTAGISVVIALSTVSFLHHKERVMRDHPAEPGYVIRKLAFPIEKPREPRAPQNAKKSQPVERMAQRKFTSQPTIKEDDKVKDNMPPVGELPGKNPGPENSAGIPAVGIVQQPGALVPGPVPAGNGTINEIVPVEEGPEFPGGADALRRFLLKNIVTPGDLGAGEKRVVKIKFKVDRDGSINSFEVVTSAGGEFDNEVVRVCRKMPRWKPALQNGVNVPVSYILPVTFIGLE